MNELSGRYFTAMIPDYNFKFVTVQSLANTIWVYKDEETHL